MKKGFPHRLDSMNGNPKQHTRSGRTCVHYNHLRPNFQR